jgi:hypothetical protein
MAMMMNAGPSGFQGAPVTKGLLTVVTVATISLALLQSGYVAVLQPMLVLRYGQWWRLFLHHLAFQSSGEALLGAILLYFTRMFERRYGSAKYASRLTVISVFATACQMALLLTVGRGVSLTMRRPGKQAASYEMTPCAAPGPYGVIYAALVDYFIDVPVTYRFRLGANRRRSPFWSTTSVSDKSLVYLIALQLALTRGKASLVSALAAILASILYRSAPGRVKQWRYPESIGRRIRSLWRPPVVEPPQRSTASRSTATLLSSSAAPVPLRPDLLSSVESISSSPSDDHIQHLVAMGFSRDAAIQALTQTRNDLHRATHLLIDS